MFHFLFSHFPAESLCYSFALNGSGHVDDNSTTNTHAETKRPYEQWIVIFSPFGQRNAGLGIKREPFDFKLTIMSKC